MTTDYLTFLFNNLTKLTDFLYFNLSVETEGGEKKMEGTSLVVASFNKGLSIAGKASVVLELYMRGQVTRKMSAGWFWKLQNDVGRSWDIISEVVDAM